MSFRYPLFLSRVSAGFPSPADDHVDQTIDLHKTLVKNPPATFFVRVQGDSMQGAGVFDGDLLVVDRSIPPRSGCVVVVAIDGELMVKRLIHERGATILRAENPNYADVRMEDDETHELHVWGVVTNVIHSLLSN